MYLTVRSWNETHRELFAILRRHLAMTMAMLDEHNEHPLLGEMAERIAELTGMTRFYLARKFDAKEKYDIAYCHHTWLFKNTLASQLHALITEFTELWSTTVEDVKYVVAARNENWTAREGGLSLEMFANERSLYNLSFTIVPAGLFALDGERALLLSRLQGGADRFEEIRRATRDLSDVAPRALLLSALSGVAKAMGLTYIVGVDAGNQLGFEPDRRDQLERQYDDLFVSSGAARLTSGLYALDVRAEPKPIASVKAGHRIRTRRKREFKQQISDEVLRAWATKLGRGAAAVEPWPESASSQGAADMAAAAC